MRKSALLKGLISAGMMAIIKARRVPAQTMADIPSSTRIACANFLEHLEYMLNASERGEDVTYWQELDRERRGLHERLMIELRKIGIDPKWRGEAEQIARDIDRRRWRAKKSVGIKARRVPAQTMADIPSSTRIAAEEYWDCVLLMQQSRKKPPEWWEKRDTERRAKHRRFLDELAKVGIAWRGADDPQRIAREIARRKWRAKGGQVSSLARWIEKARRLGWRLPRSGIEARAEAVLYPAGGARIYAPRLTLREDGTWELGRRADNVVRKRGRGNLPSVAEAQRLSREWGA